jgi:hypothetical protein
MVDDASKRMVFHLHSYVLGKNHGRVDLERQWPKDWWEAVKERFAPRWFLKRWPVRYESVSVHEVVWKVCPHVNLKTPDQRQVHFQWLDGDERRRGKP